MICHLPPLSLILSINRYPSALLVGYYREQSEKDQALLRDALWLQYVHPFVLRAGDLALENARRDEPDPDVSRRVVHLLKNAVEIADLIGRQDDFNEFIVLLKKKGALNNLEDLWISQEVQEISLLRNRNTEVLAMKPPAYLSNKILDVLREIGEYEALGSVFPGFDFSPEGSGLAESAGVDDEAPAFL